MFRRSFNNHYQCLYLNVLYSSLLDNIYIHKINSMTQLEAVSLSSSMIRIVQLISTASFRVLVFFFHSENLKITI